MKQIVSEARAELVRSTLAEYTAFLLSWSSSPPPLHFITQNEAFTNLVDLLVGMVEKDETDIDPS